MPAQVVKVGLDPKRQIQFRKALDLTTKLVTVSVLEYWRVVFASRNNDPSLCDGASDGKNTIPIVGSDWRGKGIAWCTDVLPQLDPQSAGQQYLVQTSFSSRQPVNSNQGKWDVSVDFDGEAVQETLFFDLNNKAIVNSAGQPFTQQPNKTHYISTLQLAFKSQTFDETDAEALRGTINASQVTLSIAALQYNRVFPPGTLLFDKFRASPSVQAGQLSYWSVVEQFKYLPLIKSPIDGSTQSAWQLFALDQGYMELVFGQLTDIYDSKGNPVRAPVFLDGAGNVSTSAHYLEFITAQPADFTPLFAGIG